MTQPRNFSLRRRSRGDGGFTLVEVIVTVVLLGLVMGVISAAVIAIFRSQDGVVASTAESHDTRQLVSYFPQDIESGPSRVDAYVATSGAATTLDDSTVLPPTAGGGCDPNGVGNVLVIEVTKGRSDVTRRRLAYLFDPGTETARIDRYECEYDTEATTPGWETVSVVNVADYLDPSATVESIVHLLDPQLVDRVELRYTQRGTVESIVASPREERPRGSFGVCDQDPLSAALNMAAFVERDVRLDSSITKGALFVGGILSFSGSSTVAQADPPDPEAPMPANTGLFASIVDWAGSSGQLDVKPHFDAIIQNGDFQRAGNVVQAAAGSAAKIGMGASGVVTDGGPTPVVSAGEAFASLRACSDRLAALPLSCDNGACADEALPYSLSPTEIRLDLADPGEATVLNLEADKLTALASATIKFAPSEQPSVSQPLIINVGSPIGATVEFQPPAIQGAGNFSEYILWNFPNADEVVLTGGTLWGTLMSPYAEVTSAADIEGGVISRKLTMDNATLHDVRYFQGELAW